MTDFARLLNPEQYAAATAGDGPILVLAAAGTGKTRTLVHRVAFLVEKGIPSYNLLLLTFTNRAAHEMLERAEIVCGGGVRDVWGGTFHSVCHRLLRRHAACLGYQQDFTILDRDDSRTLIEKCVKDLGLKSKDFPKRDVLASLFGNAANREITIEELLEDSAETLSASAEDIASVYHAYKAEKFKGGYMDFDDLLVNGLRLLQEHEEVRRRYQEQFQHVLVDEYQDTNILQSKFVDIIGAGHRNVMAVGDDFQCIYSWRGADFRNIMDFPKRYPDAQIIKLERNYRSSPEILEVANACIAGNPEQFQKTLRATRQSLIRPRFCYLRDGQEQADFVVDLIHSYLNNGHDLREIAVLYRAHFHSIELQMALSRNGIPHQIVSGTGVFELVHTKDVLAFLRVAEYPNDRLSFERLLGLLRGLGPRSIASVENKLGGAFNSADQASREKLMAALPPKIRAEWAPIDKVLADYHELGLGSNGSEAVDRFVAAFYERYLERTFENAETRLEDVREIGIQVSQAKSVRAFLEEVALWSNVEAEYTRDPANKPDAVRLSTVHQAKGLEWPVVIILWACEGMFPSSKSIEADGDDSEERRLFYVAVTRAKDDLIVMAPEWRTSRDGGSFYCKPSRFVQEIPTPLVRSVYGRRIR